MKVRKSDKRIASILLAAISSVSGVIRAADADVTWVGGTSGAPQDWNTIANWSSNPSGQTVDINTTTGGNYPIITTNATFAPTDIRIGTANIGRLDQTGGLAGTGNGNWMYLGYGAGTATFNLADTTKGGGTTTGFGQGAGSFNVGGGSPNGANLFIGLDNGTTSTVNVNTTGTLSSGYIYVGGAGSSKGTLNIDSGTVYAQNDIRIAGDPFTNPANSAGNDVLNMSGGTLSGNVIAFSRGDNNTNSGVGIGLVSGGTINARAWLTLGFCGNTTAKGILTNTGGTINVDASNGGGMMEMSTFDSAGALYTQTAGALNLDYGCNIGYGNGGNNNGTSDFEQNGGTVTFYSDGGVTPGGGGSLILGVGNSTGIYSYNLNSGTLTVPSITKASAGATGTFNFNGGTLKAAATTANFMTGLTAANVLAGGAIINSNGQNVTIAQSLLTGVTGSADGGLAKSGTGTLTLSASNTYTGPTTITGGTLSLGGSGSINSTSQISVTGGGKFLQLSSTTVSPTLNLSGGALDGVGSLSTVTVSNSLTNVVTSGNGSTGQLSIGSLSFAGAATTNFITSAAANTSAGILVNTLATGSTAGQIKVNVTDTDSAWVNGTYDLLGFNSATGAGFSAFSLGTVSGLTGRQSATLTNIPGSTDYIALTVSGVSGALFWTGATNGNWTTSTSAKNWTLNGTATNFQTGDVVTFDDTATGTTTIAVTDTTVSPTSVTFNNSSKSYTINGPGAIAGAATMTLNGAGTVTLANSNTFTGGTSLNAGTLNLNNPSAIGTGTLTLNGGTLDSTAATPVTLSTNNPEVWGTNVNFGGTTALNMGSGTVSLSNASTNVTVNGSAPVTIGGTISGAGATLTKLGAGTLVLSGSSNFGGATLVNAGTLVVTGSGAQLTSTPTIANGPGFTGTLNISNGAVVTSPGEFSVTYNGGTGVVNVVDGGSLVGNGLITVGHGLGSTSPGNSTLNILGGTVTASSTGSQFATGSYGGNTSNVAVTNVGYGSNGTTPGVVNSNSEILVGDNGGIGTFNVLNGGQVTSNNWLIVGRQGGVGVLNVSGNATINKSSNNPFYVGFSYSTAGATGTVNQNGGTITSAAVLSFGNEAADTGAYNLNGGTLVVPQVTQGAGSGTLNFNGGVLKANTGATNPFLVGLTATNVRAGGAIIDTNGQSITVGQALVHSAIAGDSAVDGGLTKQGGGTLTLSASNTYTGPTTIKAGTIQLSPAGKQALISAYSFDNPATSPVGTPTSITNSGSGGTALNGAVIQSNTSSTSVQIVSGGPNINGNGGIGNALSFDGSGGKVDISSGITDLSGTGSWTVSAWVQTSQAGSTILSKDTNSTWGTGNSIFYFGSGTGPGGGTLASGVRYAGGFVSGSTPVTDGNWHMVTYVDNAGTKQIYVDGVADSLTQTGFTTADLGNLVELGFTPDTVVADGTANMLGNLDDINIFSGALSSTQVTQLFNTNATPLAPSPNVLPATTPVIMTASGATLDLGGNIQTIASLNGVSGTFVILGGGMLTVGDSTSTTFAGNINDAGGANNASGGILIKQGSGTLTLSAINNYSGGTVVNAGLIVAGSGTASLGTGLVNLNAGGVIFKNTSSSSIFTLLKSGYNGGTWNGASGIISTSAATDSSHLHAVGMYQPTSATTFEGQPLGTGDVAIKYTYYGDANLDGKVDGSDYSRIDSGYVSHTTGWQNGDFNYDGAINGSDYTLIDNAFNRQGAVISAEIASPTSIVGTGGSTVPEPASGLLLAGVTALLGRRSGARRRQ